MVDRDLHARFEDKHNEVLSLRKQIEELWFDLQMKERTLRDAERDSAFLFQQMFDRRGDQSKAESHQ